ncbi:MULTISPECIES: Imm26 family immunity protein [unclassified Pseudoalteromonas]|uniref:Imm26 family immunity protein n=1 Tax=unclassified Pseudoalteromonas TaxID=194690 RepID=UPI0013FE2AFD|nr:MULTISPECIES: Imm26 family immunity protein [unclassified Pseudoalteromonas]MBQ4859243.1 hypothetical protein [Pseudoalteromonas sp. MMG007]
MEYPETNVVRQTAYKKRLKVGDVFRLEYPEKKYIFGRIMTLDSEVGGFPDCIKIHIYNVISEQIEIPKNLIQEPLLVAPVFINKLGFSRGYMPVIGNIAVEPNQNDDGACYLKVFPSCCHVDEAGNEIEENELEGVWGLGNYRTMDDSISKALGIPEAPDEDDE